MDFGELILYILIGTGLLSQLFGGKKKQQAQRQRRPPPPPSSSKEPASGQAAATRQKASSYMERILKELELDDLLENKTSEPPVTIRPPTGTATPPGYETPRYEPPAYQTPRSYDEEAAAAQTVRRPPPEPEAKSLESLEPSGAAEHVRFHELYVKPLSPGQVSRAKSRVHKLLSNNSLRDAILLREIIGPPKALE